MHIPPMEISKKHFWLLAAVCACTLFPFLGETLFNTRGEPREAVVALYMLQDGNWILPVNNGVDLAYKPPLFHWMVAIVSWLCGGVSEFTSRVPSALALSLMVLAGYVFYARRRGTEVAFLAALVTLSNFEVHRAGVACRVDMVLTLMIVAALYSLYRWTERDLRGMPWLALLCLVGAFLSKGPVGLGLPCLVIGIFCLLRGYGFWRTFLRLAGVALLACLLSGLWYVAAWQQGGQRFLDLVYEENVLRLLGKMSYESHVNPWPYNVMTLVAGFVPYTLLAVFALCVVRWRVPRFEPAEWWRRLRAHVRTVDPVRLFTFLSFAVIFVFYCIPKSKRSVYLLPVYPFLSYYLAELFLWLRSHHERVLQVFGRLLAVLAVLLTLLFGVVRAGCVPESWLGGGSHAAQNQAMLRALGSTPLSLVDWCLCLLPVVTVWVYMRVRGHDSRARARRLYAMIALVFALFVSLDAVYQPLVLNTKSDKPQAEFVRRTVPEGLVYSFRTDVVPGNPLHPFTINYYLGDRVVPFTAFMPRSGYLLTGDNDIEAFRQRYPDYRVRLVADFNHRSCDDRRMLYFYHFDRP